MIIVNKYFFVTQVSYDADILEIAYKYFMSTTLAVRMAGLNLITNQIHNMIELGQNQVFGDLDSLCTGDGHTLLFSCRIIL